MPSNRSIKKASTLQLRPSASPFSFTLTKTCREAVAYIVRTCFGVSYHEGFLFVSLGWKRKHTFISTMDGDVEQLRSMHELEADLAGYREELKQVSKAS